MRRFADEAEKLVADNTQPVERSQLLITDIEIQRDGLTATITWTCSEAATYRVEWGDDIPDYGQEATVDAPAATEGQYVLQGTNDTRSYVRIHARLGIKPSSVAIT